MGLFIHFHIIFGTNLLTGGPAKITVFFAYFSVSKEKDIKRNPSWGLFRRSAGGAIDHGGLLHQHRSLSDDV